MAPIPKLIFKLGLAGFSRPHCLCATVPVSTGKDRLADRAVLQSHDALSISQFVSSLQADSYGKPAVTSDLCGRHHSPDAR